MELVNTECLAREEGGHTLLSSPSVLTDVVQELLLMIGWHGMKGAHFVILTLHAKECCPGTAPDAAKITVRHGMKMGTCYYSYLWC